MAYTGFNFRESSGHVTDGSGETYVTAGDTYPTSRGGQTFGWSVEVTDVDRSPGSQDRRVGGVNYYGAASQFRIDLPATGTYDIRLALGDYGDGAYNEATVKIYDDATLKATINPLAVAADQYLDATGVLRNTVATWASANVAATITFASTILILDFTPEVALFSAIAHASFEESGGGGGGGIVPVKMKAYAQMRRN